MSLETKRIKELFGYARTLTKEQGVGVMAGRAVGFFKRQKSAVSAVEADAGDPACRRSRPRRRLANHQHSNAAVQHTAAVFTAISGQRAGPDRAELAAGSGGRQR